MSDLGHKWKLSKFVTNQTKTVFCCQEAIKTFVTSMEFYILRNITNYLGLLSINISILTSVTCYTFMFQSSLLVIWQIDTKLEYILHMSNLKASNESCCVIYCKRLWFIYLSNPKYSLCPNGGLIHTSIAK